ncbi:hypothetical protein, partial [Campylobacter coli]|uniref:hypothetical protein n=1 Tax=Campylobacter coli TaxID=195 RepID=UPI003F7BFE70
RVNPSAAFLTDQIARLPQGLSNQSGQPYDPANVGGYVDSSLQNAAFQSIQGVDIAAEYRIDFASGDKLNLSGSASYLESEQQLSAGQRTT